MNHICITRPRTPPTAGLAQATLVLACGGGVRQQENQTMSILFYILGAIVLAYWGYSMAQPQWNRPRVIMENGGVILIVGTVLLVIGFVI